MVFLLFIFVNSLYTYYYNYIYRYYRSTCQRYIETYIALATYLTARRFHSDI